jgi:hypothetical protein
MFFLIEKMLVVQTVDASNNEALFDRVQMWHKVALIIVDDWVHQ